MCGHCTLYVLVWMNIFGIGTYVRTYIYGTKPIHTHVLHIIIRYLDTACERVLGIPFLNLNSSVPIYAVFTLNVFIGDDDDL